MANSEAEERMGFDVLENKSSTVGEKSGRESALQWGCGPPHPTATVCCHEVVTEIGEKGMV